MRRRRKTRETLSVSLFPFLAVLICTLGVLIVLLVLAVKAADVNAAEAHSQELEDQKAEVRELVFQYETRMIQIDGLKQVRPEAVERLHAARNHRGHLEDEIRNLKQKARRLAEELAYLEEPPTQDTDQLQLTQQTDELNAEIQVARQNLQQKRLQANTTGSSTYSIVPHSGSGGTQRRPIFIECTKDALVLQPLGIRIAKSEFVPPLESGNMLDSALLAIREYWENYNLTGDEGRPYPLLVVRPEGAETYALARRAMKSWDDEFGYELVESFKELDFGVKDEQLRGKVEQAITDARNRQSIQLARRNRIAASYAQAGTQAGASRRPGLSASGRMGGFVSTNDHNMSAHRLVDQSADQSGTENTSVRGYFDELKTPQQNSKETAGNRQSRQGADSSRSTEFGGQNSAQATGSADSQSQSPANIQSPYEQMSLAKSRGQNWALPSQTSGATGYVRPIRVVCGAHELEIHSVLGKETSVSATDGIENAVDPLINEIWRQIESWGVAGGGSYWKPELRISVLPGGELNFEKLKGLLFDSGVSLKESDQ